MSLISAVQDFLGDFTELETGAPLWVNYLNETPTAYAVIPLPGARKLEVYLDNSSLREYPFAFQIMESTADEGQRLDNAEFAEAFAEWLDEQTNDGTLPLMDSGQTPDRIEAVNWGYLDQQGASGTAIYLITCRLVYNQDA